MNIDLKGKKTYIMAVALICWALGGAVAGKIDWSTAIAEIIAALGLMGLRLGIDSK